MMWLITFTNFEFFSIYIAPVSDRVPFSVFEKLNMLSFMNKFSIVLKLISELNVLPFMNMFCLVIIFTSYMDRIH